MRDDFSDVTFESVPSTADLLGAIQQFICRFVAFPSQHQVTAVSLWILHTWAIEVADASGYLAITSPEKRSGKTRLLELLALLVRRAWMILSPSESVLYRKIEADQPTLLLDEADTIFKDKSSAYEPIRAILNSGYRRGATVPRCVGEGTKMTVQDFSVFCAKAIAGIGELPDTVADRCIPIRLKRRADEPVERFSYRKVSEEAEAIRSQLAKWAELVAPDLVDADPAVPSGLSDRAEEAWLPLLAIADHAGEAWPQAARDAAEELHEVRSNSSTGTLLLEHIQTVFEVEGKQQLATSDLLSQLVAIEEGPWGEWWGAEVERDHTRGPASRLARLLKPFDIRPKKIRWRETTCQGYERDQFKDAFNRYLNSRSMPLDKITRNNGTQQVNDQIKAENEEFQNARKTASELGCSVVPTLFHQIGGTGLFDTPERRAEVVSSVDLTRESFCFQRGCSDYSPYECRAETICPRDRRTA